jgi:iron complex outermembrane recepter protein
MKHHRIRLLQASAIAAGLVASPALAQQQAAPADSQEIIVTAQKRAESSLKVPTAITVLRGTDLKSQGVNSVADLQNVSPGLNIARTQYGINIDMRGVQASDQTSKGEQDVAFNVDGMFLGRPQEQALAFFDVDRVEVLRGPQGTLYGRSATAGAINVITNAPKLGDLGGSLTAELGNYNTRRIEGALNIPLGDTLALRVAGNANYRDGFSTWIDQTVTTKTGTYNFSSAGLKDPNDENNLTGRASLLFQPDSTLRARLSLTLAHQGGQGELDSNYDTVKAADYGASGLALLADPVPSWQDDHFVAVNGDVTKTVGQVQAVLTASHMFFRNNDQFALGSNPAASKDDFIIHAQNSSFKTDALEARIANAAPSRIDYTIGASYYREAINENYHTWYAPVASWYDTATWVNDIEPFNTTVHTAWGAFGQATFHATDRLSLVAGLRYTHDAISRVGQLATGAVACTYPNVCPGSVDDGYESDSKLTWRAGINYQLDPANLFYADVATGFKAGGFNDIDPSKGVAAGPQPYAPEQLTAYEVGFKGRPFRNLTLTSSLFYNDFQKEQISSNLIYDGIYITYTGIASTHIVGWENEFNWRVTPHTVISGSAAFERGRYNNFLAGEYYGSQVQWSGRPLDKVPTFNGTVTLDQYFDVANGAQVRLRAGTRYNTGYYLSNPGYEVQFRQASFTRSDASLGYLAAGHRYTVELFVHNIENRVQFSNSPNQYNGATGTAANDFTPSGATPNGTQFGTTDPRTYGIRASVTF